MDTLLEKYRHDGKRYWFKNGEGRWFTLSPGSTAIAIAIDKGITKKEATTLRNTLRDLCKAVDDPAWREEVAWLEFTKRRTLYVAFDKIEFCDPYSGASTRSMKIADFNRVLREKFPSRGQVSEEGGLGLLLL